MEKRIGMYINGKGRVWQGWGWMAAGLGSTEHNTPYKPIVLMPAAPECYRFGDHVINLVA
jgi:hypothetical protein